MPFWAPTYRQPNRLQTDRDHSDQDAPPVAPSNRFGPAAIQPDHPGSFGPAIMCGVALTRVGSSGASDRSEVLLRGRSVPLEYALAEPRLSLCPDPIGSGTYVQRPRET